MNRSLEMVRLLMQHGANAFGFDPDERLRFSEGDDPTYTWGESPDHPDELPCRALRQKSPSS
jgi:hypothetical protein